MKKTFLAILFCLFALPVLAQETEYKLLAPLPGYVATNPDGETTASKYLKGIFSFTIAIAGGIAVLMIIYGGIKYMSTDAFSGKDEAKGIIESAIWGLVLTIGAWLILYTINPKLVNFDLSIARQNVGEGFDRPNIGDRGIPGPPNIALSECKDCKVISVNNKGGGTIPGQSACNLPSGQRCLVHQDLDAKLITLFQNKSVSALSAQVSEAFPPTTKHKSPCHKNGTCVDMTIDSPLARDIKAVFEAGKAAGLEVIYEALNATRATIIRHDADLTTSQVIVTEGNGEHFHIKLK